MTREEIMVRVAASLLAANEDILPSYIMNFIGESNAKYVSAVHHPKFIAKQSAMYTDALLAEMNAAKGL